MNGLLSKTRLVGSVVLAASVAACSDAGVMAPEMQGPLASSTIIGASGETCEVIDFEEFAHGDGVTSITLPLLNLTVAVTPFVNHDGVPNPNTTARAFDTNEDPAVWEDVDYLWRQPGGTCVDCQGQGRILVVEHMLGFYYDTNFRGLVGDAQYGGDIILSGFDMAPGTYHMASFRAFDNDANDSPTTVWVDGFLMGSSTNQGDATVETVVASPHTITSSVMFRMGTPEADYVGGSGAIDDIMLCQQETLGDDGCSIGYWGRHLGSWAGSGYDPDQTLESVFDVPDGLGLDDKTLREAISFGGGPGVFGASRLLLKQAVGAVLNAAHPDVDYAMTVGQIVAEVNAALASGSRSTILALKDELDALNNAGCTLD